MLWGEFGRDVFLLHDIKFVRTAGSLVMPVINISSLLHVSDLLKP